MEAKDWIFVLLQCISLYLLYRQNEIQAKALNPVSAKSGKVPISMFRRYWPMAVMIVLMAICWIPYLLSRRPADQIALPSKQKIILTWGAEAPNCILSLNGAALMEFAGESNVVMACGITDDRVDKFEDENITLSSPFTIHSAVIDISAPYSARMAATADRLYQEATRNLPAPPKINVRLQIRIWNEVVIVPKGTNMSDIRKLSDVARHRGRVLSLDPRYRL
jgi:hypothetical protein